MEDYFDCIIAQHVFYIISFLYRAGEKEAEPQSNNANVGNCIKDINCHFAYVNDDDEKVREIKSNLPNGVTELVDRRSMHSTLGALTIPDIHFYTVFAIVELVYSKMATPVNFTMFGGSLLAQILQGILQNENIISLFSDLFTPGKFSSDILLVTLQYYLKVFGNVRAKDL